MAQIGKKCVVLRKRFARAVGQLGNRLPVAFHQLQHDVQRLMSHVVGEISADAEAGFEASFEVLVQVPRAFQIQPVAECVILVRLSILSFW